MLHNKPISELGPERVSSKMPLLVGFYRTVAWRNNLRNEMPHEFDFFMSSVAPRSLGRKVC
ncbi:hypothetical protein [Maliponia aquimaris]|uniref:hypothetical protein n=1 Tax=Maliponia aquimaris TaxID=1673631 RepID=UPI00114052E0|nr:hypothetical protein [Maliponia aquimaris]